MELLLISILVQSQVGKSALDEKPVRDAFVHLVAAPEVAAWVQHFMHTVVRRTDVAGSSQDRATVRWGCKVAEDVLRKLATRDAVGE